MSGARNFLRRIKCLFGKHWVLLDEAETVKKLEDVVMTPGKVVHAEMICGWCKKRNP